MLNSIKNLRVPLTLLVIFIHCSHGSGNISLGEECIDWPLSFWAIDYLLQQIFSKILGCIAVPLFFLISGYLYFINFNQWNNNKYRQKIISRCWSLLLPYFIWNILYLFFWSVVIKKISPISAFMELGGARMFWNSGTWNDGINIWGNAIVRHDPLFGHFWYIRDLFLFSLLSPLFYLVIKKLSYWWIIFTTILFVLGLWIPNATINIVGITFFSWGASLAMTNKKFNLAFINKKTLLYSSVALMLIAFVLHDGLVYRIILNLFVICAIICTLHFTDKFDFDNHIWNRLSECSFFCFAAHRIVFPYTYSDRICIWDNPYTDLVAYLLRPIFIYGILCLIYYLLNRYLAPILNILIGRRKS